MSSRTFHCTVSSANEKIRKKQKLPQDTVHNNQTTSPISLLTSSPRGAGELTINYMEMLLFFPQALSHAAKDSKLPVKNLWKRNVVCPDDHSECPCGDTCCQLSSGSYGFCPVPNAVCCSNGVNCCPNGYSCGEDGFCLK